MRKYMVRALCGSMLLGIIALSAGLSGRGWGWGNETVSAQAAVQPVAVTGNLLSPLYVTHARDGSGRLFIVEQAGRVLVLPAEAASPLATPFLDIGPKLLAGGERGLLGLAFHPFYRDNRRFFVNYTRAGDGATVISEFSASASDPNLAETTEKILLTIPQPFANHNGGMIEFGYDGYLYIGMGDGGSSFDPGNRAQNLDELLGKFLRIDVDHPNGAVPYSSPASNPFFGDTPGRDEIFALGLRNPFRWSFDRASGNLYAGDVGQNAVEELDIVTRGANLGWRIFEGTQCTNVDPLCDRPGLTPPITQYTHTGGRCSVTGGYVYRGQRSTFPSGTYIFGDFCTGEIFTYYNNTMSLLIDTDLQLSSFGEDELGEIYAVGLDGRVFRLTGPAPPATSVSAASYRGGVFAAESIATAFGLNFSTATETAPIGQPLPTVLAGASVRVTDATGADRPAPLYYVSPG
ncbi:MAG TPA: PQQ-dependent sugar dehydrogenase, partial [Blastocatellia bacterium]|nr:PQQ-dependent sugar dehydrogenase [Blastocatellia bacterium]